MTAILMKFSTLMHIWHAYDDRIVKIEIELNIAAIGQILADCW